MCWPLAVMAPYLMAAAAVAASTAGAAMQANAAKTTEDRAAAATMAASDANQAQNDRAFNAFEASAGENTVGQVQQGIDQAAQNRLATTQQITAGAPTVATIPGQETASSAVRQVISDRAAEAQSKLAGEALARAKLGAWGDMFQGLADKTSGNQAQIAAANAAKAGNTATFQTQLGAAQLAGNNQKSAGSVVSGIGNAAASSAASSAANGSYGDLFTGSTGTYDPAAATKFSAPTYTGSGGSLLN